MDKFTAAAVAAFSAFAAAAAAALSASILAIIAKPSLLLLPAEDGTELGDSVSSFPVLASAKSSVSMPPFSFAFASSVLRASYSRRCRQSPPWQHADANRSETKGGSAVA